MKNVLRYLILLSAFCFFLQGVGKVDATSLRQRNIAELVGFADLIIVGRVIEVSDGIDSRIPYTKITIGIRETIRGEHKDRFTFRQFGLQRPRQLKDGRYNLNVTPAGWPTYRENEEVLLFLYRSAEITGLRTTVGLLQGKFNLEDGVAVNAVNNLDLFKNVSTPPARLAAAERKVLESSRGAIEADLFISLIRKAVENRWFDKPHK